MNRFKHRRGRFLLFIPMFIIGVFAFTLAVMLLWNNILPAVLGVKTISFFQAMGILVLSKILFGFSKGWRGRSGHWRHDTEQRWGAMGEKWNAMNEEERAAFKAEWKNRCGGRWGRKEEANEQ